MTTTTKKPQTEPGPLHEAQVAALNDILRAHTKKPQTERMCECGHPSAHHYPKPWGCVRVVKRSRGVVCCPCPAFTPQKEEARP